MGFSYSKAIFTSGNPTGLASEQFSDRRGISFVPVPAKTFQIFLLINRRSRDGETHKKHCALGSLYSVNDQRRTNRAVPYVIMVLLKPVAGLAITSFLSIASIAIDTSYFGFETMYDVCLSSLNECN